VALATGLVAAGAVSLGATATASASRDTIGTCSGTDANAGAAEDASPRPSRETATAVVWLRAVDPVQVGQAEIGVVKLVTEARAGIDPGAAVGRDDGADDPGEGSEAIEAESTGVKLSSRTPDPSPAAGPLVPTLSRWSAGACGAGDPPVGDEANGNAPSGPVGDANGRRGASPTSERRWTDADAGSRQDPPRAGSTRRCGLDDSADDCPTSAEPDGCSGKADEAEEAADSVAPGSAALPGRSNAPIGTDPNVGATNGIATNGIATGVGSPADSLCAGAASGAESAAGMEIGSPGGGEAGVGAGVGATIGPDVLRWIGTWAADAGRVGISRSGAPMPPGRVRQAVGRR